MSDGAGHRGAAPSETCYTFLLYYRGGEPQAARVLRARRRARQLHPGIGRRSASRSPRSAARCGCSRSSCARPCFTATAAASSSRRPGNASARARPDGAPGRRQRALGALNELRADPRGKVVIGLPSRVATRADHAAWCASSAGEFPHASITVAEGLSSVAARMAAARHASTSRCSSIRRAAPTSTSSRCMTRSSSWWGRTAARPARGEAHCPQADREVPADPAARAQRDALGLEAAADRLGCELNVSTEVDTVQNILELVARSDGLRRPAARRGAKAAAATRASA